MPLRNSIFAVALLAFFAVPVAAAAQDVVPARLAAGVWTGVVHPPNEGPVDVTYEVTYRGDTLGVVLVAGPHGRFTLSDLEITATRFSFAFTPGPHVVCALKLNEEGGYAGECTDDGGSVVPMTMIPPAKDPTAPESGA